MKLTCSLICLFFCVVTAKVVDWTNIRTNNDFKKNYLTSRIVGGEVATRGQFPYQVAIFVDETGFCGGVLISDTAVLTVADCVSRAVETEVHLGAQSLFSLNEPGHVIVTSREVKVHENFQIGVSFNYDIAVITLPEPVTGQYIAPIRLPTYSQENTAFTNETALTAGWGSIDDLIPGLSSDLMFAEVRVTSLSECQLDYSIVNERFVCASTNFGEVGICSGDTGGPLVVRENDGLETLIGIAAFGHPMGCEKSAPNVYTRTSKYLDWIQDNAPGVNILP